LVQALKKRSNEDAFNHITKHQQNNNSYFRFVLKLMQMFKKYKGIYTIMKSGGEISPSGEIVARSPGDIQVVIYGESFPVKRLMYAHSSINADCPDIPSFSGCVELGEWLTDAQRNELRKLMSSPKDNSATVFQILINMPPTRRLICEWPRDCLDQKDSYHFTQLVDLER
jgi:hypothetical protein